MIEVFKTDVIEPDDAQMLIENIQHTFTQYQVNFDLDDCDKILRVCCQEEVDPHPLILFISRFGFKAEVLPVLCCFCGTISCF